MMIKPALFVEALAETGVNFIAGVPDSLLKDLCAKLTVELPAKNHIIAANEGSAIGLAIGHYLATSNPAMVYMQNSGLGNAVNPLTSLADPKVYSIPMLLVIGWRGEILETGTQLPDEPQHKKQGEITLDQLNILDIPYKVIDKGTTNLNEVLLELISLSITRSGPVAIIVRKGTFSPFKYESEKVQKYPLLREEAIEIIVDNIDKGTPIVSTTGVASRELFEIRKRKGQGHSRDFLTVGGMGYASSIAAGIANALPDKKIVCIDGDGAALMHLGALAITADCSNLIHFLINNEAHDSVGGQPTKGAGINFSSVGKDLGYSHTFEVESKEDLKALCLAMKGNEGSVLITVKTRAGFRSDLGRPDRSPIENKKDFMGLLRDVDYAD
jgi:phosphonopyruvate decarboxylase